MNRLTNLALSVGETLFHEAGRLLFGIALGAAPQIPDLQQLGRFVALKFLAEDLAQHATCRLTPCLCL